MEERNETRVVSWKSLRRAYHKEVRKMVRESKEVKYSMKEWARKNNRIGSVDLVSPKVNDVIEKGKIYISPGKPRVSKRGKVAAAKKEMVDDDE